MEGAAAEAGSGDGGTRTSLAPADSIIFKGDAALLLLLASYLDLQDLPAFACISKETAALLKIDCLYRQVWPGAKGAGKPPMGSGSTWKDACSLLALYRQATLHRLTLGYEHLLRDVTAPCYSAEYRCYGMMNGPHAVVRVFGPLHELDKHKDCILEGSGSIRHMYINQATNILYAGSWNGTIHAVDLRTGAVRLAAQSSPATPVFAVRLFGQVLVACQGDAGIQLYDVNTGEALGQLEGHSGAVTDFSVYRPTATRHDTVDPSWPMRPARARSASWDDSTTAFLVSASYDHSLRVWDVPGRRCLAILEGHRAPVWTVATQPGVIISGGADGSLRLWKLQTEQLEASAAGPRVISCQRVLSALPGSSQGAHRQIFCCKTFGDVVVCGTSDGMLQCWNMNSGALLWTAPGYDQTSSFTGHGKDGIRRLDIVRDWVFTCTRHGHVNTFRLTKLGVAPVWTPRAAAAAASASASVSPSSSPRADRADSSAAAAAEPASGSGGAQSHGAALAALLPATTVPNLAMPSLPQLVRVSSLDNRTLRSAVQRDSSAESSPRPQSSGSLAPPRESLPADWKAASPTAEEAAAASEDGTGSSASTLPDGS